MRTKILIIFLTITFLQGCDNSEKQARLLLNQAIKDWDEGEITFAERKFELIETNYLETSVATESIKERSQRKQKYKAKYNPVLAKRANRGQFSRKVYQAIEAFFEANGAYPENLNTIEPKDVSDSAKYLSLCSYDRALFNYGYQLNCKAADTAYKSEALSNLHRSTGKNSSTSKKQIKVIDDFPQANRTWGDKFNPNNDIPSKGFRAYYFDTSEPTQVIARELVDGVKINYIYNKFQNIRSQDFGAYWVGTVKLDKSETKQIAISQSWAKTRLIIDGRIVYEGGSDKEILLTLAEGNHLVEVEYVNNWHTTEFSVSFIDQVEKLTPAEIEQRLKSNLLGDYEIYYAGLYESDKKDLSVVLNMEKTSKQIVLFLGSYSSIQWHISNPFDVDIRAVVYGSYSPGTTVVGDINPETLLLVANGQIGSHSAQRKCSCVGSHFHCEGRSLMSTKNTVEKMGRSKLTGFSGKYSAGSLRIPEVIVNSRYLEDLEQEAKEVDVARQSCKKQTDPNFENMFDGK
ncbi:hypothetical protein [Alkalimarinus alittae]|uniref:PA14 domain-containing protein n=1 Tax=Alkalimarinus alittae TaxID=2961619 RepID=A0ABY6N013_9ALTE|nr:hypothetical protein [Alkalimarinus alittae]UZE95438.1 hypothetical protein NKI27_15390 [Alkalimarinus alittae]